MKRVALLIEIILALGLNCGASGPTLQGIAECDSPIERSLAPPLIAENTDKLRQKGPKHQLERLLRYSKTNRLASSYATHDPISISSNAEFAARGFPGAGTIGDPYQIAGFNITNSTGPLIAIRDTSAYFRIRENLLNGLDQASWGISLSNVFHGTIEHNVIANTTNDGIRLLSSNDNIIRNNTVYSNNWAGIRLEASGNTISNNRIYDNAKIGIYLEDSFDNTLTRNTLINNGFCGLQLWFSGGNTLANNTLAYHSYGALLLSSNNNTVMWNDFFRNNLGGVSQAHDEGSGNTFSSNYWHDWTSPDGDSDGIVDNPYIIEGSANQQDLSPLVTPSATTLEPPFILYPNGGETLLGSVAIQWTPTEDPLRHSIAYSVHCSADGGTKWKRLASNLTETTYVWNTRTTEAQGANCRIKVVATTDLGLSAEDISDESFTIASAGSESNGFETPFLVILGLLILIFLLLSLGLGYVLINSRAQKQPDFNAFIQSAQIDFLEAIYYKVQIGLEKVNVELLTETGIQPEQTALVRYFPLAEPVEISDLETVEPPDLTDYFPPDIRYDLKSRIKGRTVLALIEIAYQYPDGTNPMNLAKQLDIPPTTITNEINRLTKLQYIEPYVSGKALQDGRYRYYTITPKGSNFLHSLKGALDITISRLRALSREIR